MRPSTFGIFAVRAVRAVGVGVPEMVVDPWDVHPLSAMVAASAAIGMSNLRLIAQRYIR